MTAFNSPMFLISFLMCFIPTFSKGIVEKEFNAAISDLRDKVNQMKKKNLIELILKRANEIKYKIKHKLVKFTFVQLADYYNILILESDPLLVLKNSSIAAREAFFQQTDFKDYIKHYETLPVTPKTSILNKVLPKTKTPKESKKTENQVAQTTQKISNYFEKIRGQRSLKRAKRNQVRALKRIQRSREEEEKRLKATKELADQKFNDLVDFQRQQDYLARNKIPERTLLEQRSQMVEDLVSEPDIPDHSSIGISSEDDQEDEQSNSTSEPMPETLPDAKSVVSQTLTKSQRKRLRKKNRALRV